MSKFNITEFKNALQDSIKRSKRDLSLTLVSALLMPYDDVKELFQKNDFDPALLSKGLKFELQQEDARRKRLEAAVKEQEGEFNAESFEMKQHRSRMDLWEKKSEDEALYSLIAAVELRAHLENREPTGADVLKEMVIRQKNALNEGAGTETFRILNVDFYKLFPDLEEKRKKDTHQNSSEAGQHSAVIAESVLSRIVERYPGLKKLLEGEQAGFANKLGGGRAPV